MKSVKSIFYFLLIFGVQVWGHELQIMAPGYQVRYIENEDQESTLKTFENYSLFTTLNNGLFFGLEFNKFSENSGNATLNVTTRFTEFNVLGGYHIFSTDLDVENAIYFDAGPFLLLGSNKTSVTTEFGLLSNTTDSQSYFDGGVGMMVQLRLNVFSFQVESRYMFSDGYQPSYVPVTSARLGININY